MRSTPIFLLLAALFLASAGPARALSDADHAAFSQESPAFVQAEKRLNTVWRQLRKNLSKEEFQRLLEDQRVWINSLRDEEARAESGAVSRAAAYAAVTERRAAVLEGRLAGKTASTPAAPAAAPAAPTAPPASPAPSSVPGGAPGSVAPPPAAPSPTAGGGMAPVPPPESTKRPLSAGGKPGPVSGDISTGVAPAPDAGRAVGIAGVYEKENGAVSISPAGDAYLVSVNTSAPDASWLCNAEGRASLQGNVLRLQDRANPELQAVVIAIEGDKAIIGYDASELCGAGGTMGGVYVKKKTRMK